MKDFTKDLISYTVAVGVPTIFGGVIGAAMYSMGHADGERDGLNQAATIVKSFISNTETEKTEEK